MRTAVRCNTKPLPEPWQLKENCVTMCSGIRLNEELGVLMGKQHYMTYPERIRLETLLGEKRSISYIAGKLGFSRQTIYNEIRRGTYLHTCDYWEEERYSAQKAQRVTEYNQTAKGRPLKIGTDHAYADFLEHKILEDRFSPAAALAAARGAGYQTQISVNTLYSYIDKKVFYQLGNKHLWEKWKKRAKKSEDEEPRIAHPQLPSIEDRPDRIARRLEYGHWEMDLVVSCKGGRSVLLTLTERMSRQEIIIKLPNRKAETIRRALDRLEHKTPDFRQKFKSITTDNGSEFLQYDLLCQSVHGGPRFQLWYCHSYAAWEKGSNENHNRMIRRFFPKGTNFDQVTEEQVHWVQEWMNHYPRKVLDWRTPGELAG